MAEILYRRLFKKGIDSGEFNPVQIKETTSIIIMMINEILQKNDYKAKSGHADS